ncbi:MAG TPA: hypothetical protein VNJ70_13910 [Thermoanaerobaculia bacterium]|nr:hypothetical protein [Thermoanaerobaculia bacterium]
MNFDNGFVIFDLACPTIDPCCPPWTSALLEEMLFYQRTGGIAKPYTLRFQPTLLFTNQIQAYIDYLGLLNPSIHQIVIHFRLHDAGTGTLPVVGAQVGNDYFTWWNAGGGGQQHGATSFFNLPGETMKVNRWYRIHTGIFLNDGIRFFPESCDNNEVDVRIQVIRSAVSASSAKPVLQIRKADGRIIERQLEMEK